MLMRHLLRIGSATLLAAGAVTLSATPALAAEVDFGVELSSATGLGVTVISATITNYGTTAPDRMTVRMDASSIDESQATALGSCGKNGAVFECVLLAANSNVPEPGKSVSERVVFWRPAGSTPGAVGSVTASVTAEGDGSAGNDSTSIPVVTAENRSPVLNISAETVTQVSSVDTLSSSGKESSGGVPAKASSGGVSAQGDYAVIYTGKPIPPGGRSLAFGEIYNYGAVPATSVRSVGKLPEGVRFITDGLDNCDFSADRRTATCVWDDARVDPFVFDTTLDGYSSHRIEMPIKVDADAEGPVDLAGGSWTVATVATEEPELNNLTGVNSRIGELFAGKKFTADENADFAVRIGAAATGGGSGNGGNGNGNGGDSDEPGLPITGPSTTAVLGTGGALVTLGVFLAYASRRRKTA